MGLKLEIKGMMLGGYAKLWSGSECPQGERVVTGAEWTCR